MCRIRTVNLNGLDDIPLVRTNSFLSAVEVDFLVFLFKTNRYYDYKICGLYCKFDHTLQYITYIDIILHVYRTSGLQIRNNDFPL